MLTMARRRSVLLTRRHKGPLGFRPAPKSLQLKFRHAVILRHVTGHQGPLAKPGPVRGVCRDQARRRCFGDGLAPGMSRANQVKKMISSSTSRSFDKCSVLDVFLQDLKDFTWIVLGLMGIDWEPKPKRQRNVSVAAIHGDRTQTEREEAETT